ncbi:MAG: outer membrane protein assembly factor BamA [Pseudomonadota bacterium]|nr:outer membrane protein assembly factor BamA [Pseudomonadota bacterium]
MMFTKRNIYILVGVLSSLLVREAQAFDPWVVQNFRVEGAQRIAEGTVYNYLPINIGDTVTDQLAQEGIRALYATGFFRDVELRKDDNALIITVLEKPSILEFTIEGNVELETEQLEENMREVGLTPGSVFDRSVLEEVTQFLTETYYGRGRYSVKVDTPVEEVGNNQVSVAINIDEGERAKIRQINIVGNASFEDEELLRDFELSTGNWLSFMRNDDRYAKEALEGDLEALRSFYMDRGFADFRNEGVQVAISPDMLDIFITINIEEGERYTITDIQLAGDMVVPVEDLRAEILVNPGEIFSQEMIAGSEQNMLVRLGEDGYAFAQVQAIPELNTVTRELSITFFVDAQNRVYVRRINFNGSNNVDDQVFRREMRQLEGSYLSNILVERSAVRLERLAFVESATFETTPVPGVSDIVDVDFQIEEGLPGQFGGGVGYSEWFGVQLNGHFSHSNFMGTGHQIQARITAGEYATTYNLDFTDPYRNIDGISRTLFLSYRDIKQFTSATSPFSTKVASAGVRWQYPITEYQYVQLGGSYSHAQLLTSPWSSIQSNQWVVSNGEVTVDGMHFMNTYATFDLALGWHFDSRNRVIFPTAGTRFSINLSGAIPDSEIEFYVAAVNFEKYMTIRGPWMFIINSEVSLGEAYGDYTTSLPPFRRMFGGGPGTVRGYRESWMGPRDNRGYPYGGNLVVGNSFEIAFPIPEQYAAQFRTTLFYDIGGVFDTGGVTFFDKLGDPLSYDFDYDALRHSTGIAVEWMSPMGLLRFSYAKPLNPVDSTNRLYGDRLEEFQFTVGNSF